VIEAIALAFGIIFVAELGDKSQLTAMTFAARYGFWPVVTGIAVATAALMFISVNLGRVLGDVLPGGWISLLGGLAFIGFGLWTLRGDDDEDEETEDLHDPKSKWAVAVAVGGAFFLAELGDKTMLATFALATNNEWFGTWIGSTLGMVSADVLAIALGAWLGKTLPTEVIKYGAAVLFFMFGALLVVQGIQAL
jgi:Ca2+/H+ antiporter, TMEM165/GDT1 family